jgi:hypothetical protein
VISQIRLYLFFDVATHRIFRKRFIEARFTKAHHGVSENLQISPKTAVSMGTLRVRNNTGFILQCVAMLL